MRNVDGYDVSRLLDGSLGTLADLEVSLKVMQRDRTRDAADRESCHRAPQLNTGRQPSPNASAWWDGNLSCGCAARSPRCAAPAARRRHRRARARQPFWAGCATTTTSFTAAQQAVASVARLAGACRSGAPFALAAADVEWAARTRRAAHAGGHGARRRARAAATPAFAARDKTAGVFAPLQSPLDRIHRDLKKSFDPSGIFNPGRLYPGL